MTKNPVSTKRPYAKKGIHHYIKTKVQKDEAQLGRPLRDQPVRGKGAIRLTPWMERKFHNNGMPATVKGIIHDASSYLLSSKQMTKLCTFLKKRSNY
ncbi:hypothetical protein L3X38_033206 [Prunus dulcis]|uniref:Uncharacterized protein n=1 Tax=Prunus dulcis TaxID=3755 RepID=A0AAD4VGN1_PRUDU|nr:hypothetical protein L3X38_033206 [Prunus dulcis]